MSETFGHKLNPYRRRNSKGVKGIKQKVVVTNNPSTIGENQLLTVRFPNLGKDDVEGRSHCSDNENGNENRNENENEKSFGLFRLYTIKRNVIPIKRSNPFLIPCCNYGNGWVEDKMVCSK